jgi:cytosine/adenosine deaminase-related metal-dependent hydrolase
VSALVYAAVGTEVATVLVDGEILMRDGQLTDEQRRSSPGGPAFEANSDDGTAVGSVRRGRCRRR